MKSRFSLGGVDGSLQILELAGREDWAPAHFLAVGDGQIAATHGRYILRSKVDLLIDLQEAA